jgi:hypothetical protein
VVDSSSLFEALANFPFVFFSVREDIHSESMLNVVFPVSEIDFVLVRKIVNAFAVSSDFLQLPEVNRVIDVFFLENVWSEEHFLVINKGFLEFINQSLVFQSFGLVNCSIEAPSIGSRPL